MSTPHVAVCLGTRPEAIKMAPVVRRLREAVWCRVSVVAVAQHRRLLDDVVTFFGLDPAEDLDVMEPGQGLSPLLARVLERMDACLDRLRPDWCLVHGDTTGSYGSAMAAFHRGVRIGHVEAGLRSGSMKQPFPEEMNRSLIARLTDLHFAPTETAADNLRREGFAEESILVTGNPVVDALHWGRERIEPAPLPAGGRRRLLITAHRRESFGEPLAQVCKALRRLADRGDVEIVYPLHPNPAVAEPVRALLQDVPAIRLLQPQSYPEFLGLMTGSELILTDSGGIQEEGPSLGIPVLILRERTERPEGLEAGATQLVGTDRDRIVAAAERLLDDPDAHRAMAQAPSPFGDGQAAERIVGALERASTDREGARE